MSTLEEYEARQREVAAQLTPLLPDCPPWCVDQGGHVDPFAADPVDGTMPYTHVQHRRVVAVEDTENGQPVSWRIERFERVHATGEVDRYPTLVVLHSKGDHGFTAAQCRQVAAAMLNAADELDRLS